MVRLKSQLLALALVGGLAGCTQPAARAAPSRSEAEEAPPTEILRAAGLRYHEVLRGGAQPGDRVPMVVMLHGMGDRPRPDRVGPMAQPTRVIVPEAPLRYRDGYAWWRVSVRQNRPIRLAAGIERAAAQLADALLTLTDRYPTAGKPIVSGFSQGGMLSYAMALHHPHTLSFAHPMSGLLPLALWPDHKRPGVHYPPIVVSHGTADPIVPIDRDRALARHLDRLGHDVQFHAIDKGQHRVSPKQGELLKHTLDSAIAEQARH